MAKVINYRNLPLLLSETRERVISNFRPILRYIGLTEQQWRILRALHDNATLRPCQISEKCQILMPSLSGVLNRLEERGLIEKQRFENDPRQMFVVNTEAGLALIAKAAPLIEQQYRMLEQAIGAELLQEAYRVMDKLTTALALPVPHVELPDDAAK